MDLEIDYSSVATNGSAVERLAVPFQAAAGQCLEALGSAFDAISDSDLAEALQLLASVARVGHQVVASGVGALGLGAVTTVDQLQQIDESLAR